MANTFKWPRSDITEQVDCRFVFFLGLHQHPKEQSVDRGRRRLGDVETEVATAAETMRAYSPGSRITAICSFSVCLIFVTHDRRN